MFALWTLLGKRLLSAWRAGSAMPNPPSANPRTAGLKRQCRQTPRDRRLRSDRRLVLLISRSAGSLRRIVLVLSAACWLPPPPLVLRVGLLLLRIRRLVGVVGGLLLLFGRLGG